MEVSSASFAYPRLPGEVRAELASRLSDRPIPGAMVLSTCLRIEIAVPGNQHQLEQAVSAAFANPQGGDDLARAQVRYDLDAVIHLYRVAAGLESPFIGEKEILSQFRQAVIRSESDDGLFQKLLEGAVAIGRQVREEILADSPHASIAAVAAQAAGTAPQVAVVGAGTMATAVVSALASLPAPPPVTMVARHPEKVSIAEMEVWPIDRLEQVLAAFPVVISVTSAGRQLLSPERLKGIVSARSQPLLLVDLAMPPDFRPAPSPALTYLDVDQVAALAVAGIPNQEADSFVAAAATAAYRRVVEHPSLGPLIGDMMRAADEVVEATVERFSGRLASPGDREVLAQAVHTVARRLLAGPVSYLKHPDRDPAAPRVIASMFDLE